MTTIGFVVESIIAISPFLLFAVGIAAYSKSAGLDRQVGRLLTQKSYAVIVTAALFGAISPFCSCGVIPVIAALLASNVPLAPVMAFWIASPLMSPELFTLTALEFDLSFAIVRLIAAVFMGLMAGLITHSLSHRPAIMRPLKKVTGCVSRCDSAAGLQSAPIVWRVWRDSERRRLFFKEFIGNGWFLLRWLSVAFFLESLLIAYLPESSVIRWLGGDSLYAILKGAFIGIPAYVNGYAAIPIVSSFVEKGISLPVALTFMLAGGVTSIPAMVAVAALVRRQVFFIYLAMGLTGSILAGLTYSLFF